MEQTAGKKLEYFRNRGNLSKGARVLEKQRAHCSKGIRVSDKQGQGARKGLEHLRNKGKSFAKIFVFEKQEQPARKEPLEKHNFFEKQEQSA